MDRVRAHLLVVDDDERLRQLLRRFLAGHGYVVSTAADAAEARQILEWLLPDMMIVDVMMPGETGLQLVASIRQQSPMPVLMLSALGDVDDRIRGLEEGADDYLAKPFEPRELLLRLERILARGRQKDKPALLFGDCHYDLTSGDLSRHGTAIHLTQAERTILARLAASINQPVSRSILASLLGEDATGERTVDAHITRLRRKLGDDPRQPVHLRTQRGKGYALHSGGVST